jgi:nucleotide-binding universal stress UspA family protein
VNLSRLRVVKALQPPPLHDEASPTKELLMKILLAIDGSEYTKRMLAYLAAHDELLGPDHDFTALTVVSPVPAYAAAYLEADAIDRAYRAEAEAMLKPVLMFAAQKAWQVTPRHAVGDAASSIAEVASSGRFDLVVMGTHGHSALGGLVLGSVSTRVIAQCRVPVLLIR